MRPGAGVAHDNECSEMRTFLVVLAAAALGASCISAAALAEGRYHSLLFRPAFSVALKSGWTVAERDAGAAQIYKICASCEHGGEERGELTLDMALSASQPKSAIKLLRRTTGIAPGKVHTFSIGALRGLAFTARRQNLPIEFARSGYRTDPSGSPLEVMVVRAQGKTVTIFIDPHEATKAQTPAFMKNARVLLRTLRFGK